MILNILVIENLVVKILVIETLAIRVWSVNQNYKTIRWDSTLQKNNAVLLNFFNLVLFASDLDRSQIEFEFIEGVKSVFSIHLYISCAKKMRKNTNIYDLINHIDHNYNDKRKGNRNKKLGHAFYFNDNLICIFFSQRKSSDIFLANIK